jgi:hypothetical protein
MKETVNYCKGYSAFSPDRLPKTTENVGNSVSSSLFIVLFTPVSRGWNSITIWLIYFGFPSPLKHRFSLQTFSSYTEAATLRNNVCASATGVTVNSHASHLPKSLAAKHNQCETCVTFHCTRILTSRLYQHVPIHSFVWLPFGFDGRRANRRLQISCMSNKHTACTHKVFMFTLVCRLIFCNPLGNSTLLLPNILSISRPILTICYVLYIALNYNNGKLKKTDDYCRI